MSRKRRDFAIGRPPAQTVVAGPKTPAAGLPERSPGTPLKAEAATMETTASSAASGHRPPHAKAAVKDAGKKISDTGSDTGSNSGSVTAESGWSDGLRRRGPMAAAVRETAQAAQRRAAQAAAIRAENDALAAELVRLRRAGLVTDLVPLEAIHAGRLMRDRAPGPDPELSELVASIRSVGLSNPIRIAPAGPDSYELVEGWRRLSAYRYLLKDTGCATWARIPAAMVPEGKSLAELYRRMVDENLVRRGISFAEMAELARHYAADPQTEAADVDAAVSVLYQSAGYQKRSYIRAFAELLRWIGADLEHASAIPRKLGLDLRRQIEHAPELRTALAAQLRGLGRRDAETELAVLRDFARMPGAARADAAIQTAKAGPEIPREAEAFAATGMPSGHETLARSRGARTYLRLETPLGPIRMTAGQGRVEIRASRDFSRADQSRLEAGLRAFMAALSDDGESPPGKGS